MLMEWYIALFTCKTTADYIKCITCRHYIGVGTGGGHRGHVPPQVFSPCYVRSTKIKLCPPINKSSLYVLTIADFKHKYIYNISLPLLYLSYTGSVQHTPPTHASIHQLSCRSDSIHTYSTGLDLLYLRMFCA